MHCKSPLIREFCLFINARIISIIVFIERGGHFCKLFDLFVQVCKIVNFDTNLILNGEKRKEKR